MAKASGRNRTARVVIDYWRYLPIAGLILAALVATGLFKKSDRKRWAEKPKEKK